MGMETGDRGMISTSRIDCAHSAMIKSTHCSTCKHRGNCLPAIVQINP